MPDLINYREATPDDGPTVGKVFRAATRHDLPYLPELHTETEDDDHFREIVEIQHVTVAEIGDKIVGFCAWTPGRLNYLYILPEHQRRGIGPAMLKTVMGQNDELQLWAFQKNTRARAFYERFGFRVAELTDGRDNEEREPDVRYIWKKGN